MNRLLASLLYLGLCAGLLPGCLWAQATQPAYGPPETVCELQDARITEASGLAASRRYAGHYYVHNDSGDSARVFLIDGRGRTRLEIRLSGAGAVDYEDIALAPGRAGDRADVCVADIGDNPERRNHVVIYRFAEPDLPEGDEVVRVKPAAFQLRYADGPADAEAFVVHPATGDGYVLTKRKDGRSYVYRLAAPWPAEATLRRVAVVGLPAGLPPARMVTAADIAPDGRRLAVRTYLGGWEWRNDEPIDLTRIGDKNAYRLHLAGERQGEALGYSADGRALLTVSEGLHPALHRVAREATSSDAP